jgi:uncharacterized tellurite resistance protein B-like protein
MFRALREFFLGEQTELIVDRSGFPTDEESQLATAVLLLECARIDAEVSEREAETLCQLMSDAFGLPREKLPELVRLAVAASQSAEKKNSFFETLKANFNTIQRQKIFFMAYQIIRADGKVQTSEQSFIAQVRTRLGLTEAEAESAREMNFEGENV